MKKTILSLALLFLFNIGFGQKSPNELQVLPFVRLDWYPEFTFNYGGRFSTDSLKMKGKSWGININYKYALHNNINILVGIGYYNYSFNKLTRTNSFTGGPSNTRPIDYPSFVGIFYTTNNYSYKTFSFLIGIEKLYQINNKLKFNSSLYLNNFVLLNSVYKLPFNNIIYRKKEKSLFANSVTLNIGLEKKLRNLKIGPQILIPLFDTWHKDEAFLENQNEKRIKWLNGIGLGIQLNYPLHKK